MIESEKGGPMGKANRDRRAAKKRRAERRYTKHRSASAGGIGGQDQFDLGWLVFSAASATGERGTLWDATYSAALQRGTSGTGVVIDDLFCHCLESLWEGGWQPAEVVRAVKRRWTPEHADLSCTAVAASHSAILASPSAAWADQLADLEATGPWWGGGRDWLGPWALRRGRPWPEALRMAIEALGVLVHLPVTEVLLPPPSQWSGHEHAMHHSASAVDEAILVKVRALLAKAESTNFEHEADALTAKAQELMARHSIDQAVAESGGTRTREAPTARRVPVDDPYANAKAGLLGIIGNANNVRSVWDEREALMTLIGFEGDLDAVDLLFTSLLMQATRSMLAKGRISDGRGRSRTRSFRQSFIVAFGQRVHERLVIAARQAQETAEQEVGRSLLPVLAGRLDEVDNFTDRLFPCLSQAKGSSVTNPDGWLAGRVAAEMATLGPVQQRLDGTG
jgi:hypothetical protein